MKNLLVSKVLSFASVTHPDRYTELYCEEGAVSVLTRRACEWCKRLLYVPYEGSNISYAWYCDNACDKAHDAAIAAKRKK
jgi:hypothetical protein